MRCTVPTLFKNSPIRGFQPPWPCCTFINAVLSKQTLTRSPTEKIPLVDGMICCCSSFCPKIWQPTTHSYKLGIPFKSKRTTHATYPKLAYDLCSNSHQTLPVNTAGLHCPCGPVDKHLSIQTPTKHLPHFYRIHCPNHVFPWLFPFYLLIEIRFLFVIQNRFNYSRTSIEIVYYLVHRLAVPTPNRVRAQLLLPQKCLLILS